MSKEEKEVLYQCYLESNLSIKEFALKNDVSPSIIRGLVSYHKRINNKERSAFISIATKEEVKSNVVDFNFDNHQIKIDKSYLKDFLRCLL